MVRREAGRGRGGAGRSRERAVGDEERRREGGVVEKSEEARRRVKEAAEVKEGIVEGESVVVANIPRAAVGYNAAARMTDTPLA